MGVQLEGHDGDYIGVAKVTVVLHSFVGIVLRRLDQDKCLDMYAFLKANGLLAESQILRFCQK